MVRTLSFPLARAVAVLAAFIMPWVSRSGLLVAAAGFAGRRLGRCSGFGFGRWNPVVEVDRRRSCGLFGCALGLLEWVGAGRMCGRRMRRWRLLDVHFVCGEAWELREGC